jgi:hypothetical protein
VPDRWRVEWLELLNLGEDGRKGTITPRRLAGLKGALTRTRTVGRGREFCQGGLACGAPVMGRVNPQ